VTDYHREVTGNTLTVNQGSRYLGVSSDYLTRMLRDGRLEGTKDEATGQWSIPVEALDAHLERVESKRTQAEGRRAEAAKARADRRAEIAKSFEVHV
jgi:excisionase family DNA binding protein